MRASQEYEGLHAQSIARVSLTVVSHSLSVMIAFIMDFGFVFVFVSFFHFTCL